ncbi:hypothetical protein [Paenibacillus polymyxa]|uniref:Uncharacterized protein n=1 Tax=Paenibacillus polymyxa (strain SC2) TaxID=886882 RepID=E3E9C7_PAEPS|nr:hypothetical protein [Paenibacillus polymyxa]ADO57400.1 hypothetical protein PPSC2_16115 [Paenibacillus polymyxa SC2]WPQ55174.1 hypothetical protein SKN87_16425 [Paenibacillus polymyxa]
MPEDSGHGKVFGVSITPNDIFLEEDGTVQIRNKELSNKIRQLQTKTVENLMSTSTRGDTNIFSICF